MRDFILLGWCLITERAALQVLQKLNGHLPVFACQANIGPLRADLWNHHRRVAVQYLSLCVNAGNYEWDIRK